MKQRAVDPDGRWGRREHLRPRCLLACRIVYGVSDIVVEGTIKDLNHLGARLKLATLLVVPHQFRLIIGRDGTCFEVGVRWRRGCELGVRFLEPIDVGTSRGPSVELLRRLAAEMASRGS